MKRKKMIFIGMVMILGLGLGLGLSAATSDITVIGSVVSSSDGSPIENVQIRCVEHPTITKLTDENGEYEISIPRNSSLEASKTGYTVDSGSSTSQKFSSDSRWDLTMSQR